MGYSDAVMRSSKRHGASRKPAARVGGQPSSEGGGDSPMGGRTGAMNERAKSTQTKDYPEYAGFVPNELDPEDEYPGFKNRILADGKPGSSGVVRETQVPAYTHVEEYGSGRTLKSGNNGQTGRGAKLYGNVKSGNRP